MRCNYFKHDNGQNIISKGYQNNKKNVCLVQGWSSRSGWGFPKGKINQNESEADCAAREVFEETSLEVRRINKIIFSLCL